MGLNGEEILARLKRLSQVDSMKQVAPLSYALFPGYHCPLMGAMLTIREIDDAVLLVLGPDECAYYTKMATSGGEAHGCRIVSVVLEPHDVTFGCQENLEDAFAELAEEGCPEAVFLVTTCVPEITGDDVESLAENLAEKYHFPILVVHAENFKTDDHLPGIEHTMDVCAALMEPQQNNGSVNVLGLRLGDFSKSEVARVLQENDIPLGMTLPGHTSIHSIRMAPAAKVNLVVHPVGLPLAQAMQKKYGTPYVDFQRFSDPNAILAAYRQLFACLGKNLPSCVETWYREAETRTEQAGEVLRGGSYFSGNTALCTYELHSFLAQRLHLEAKLLQVSELGEDDAGWREIILRSSDPYVSRAANIGALKYLYPLLRPDYNIGAGSSREMRENGVVPVQMFQAYNTLGFEVNRMVVTSFLQAKAERSTL